MDLFEIRIKSGLPFIFLNRELATTDLGPVTERENVISFILDDSAWECEDGTHTMKLRFKQALDLDSQLRELHSKREITMDEILWIRLADICKVYRVSTRDESKKDEIEERFFNNCLENLQEAVDEFNLTILMKGVSA